MGFEQIRSGLSVKFSDRMQGLAGENPRGRYSLDKGRPIECLNSGRATMETAAWHEMRPDVMQG